MENLSNTNKIKELLNKYCIYTKKGLGQNFLINPSVCPKMARLCSNSEEFNVIEIGPGIGVLTNELAKVAKRVVAIEIDNKLLPVLEETLSEHKNVKIINADVLKLDLKQLIIDEFGDSKVVVCANLPYYITSPIIMHLLETEIPIDSITIMVQKEVAQRICCDLGKREAGAISVAVNYYSTPEILFEVSRGSFFPPPNVDSAVIKLNIKTEGKLGEKQKEVFFKIVKAAFCMRRKTLLNSLSSGLSISKKQVEESILRCNIDLNIRPEKLLLSDFETLSSEFLNLI